MNDSDGYISDCDRNVTKRRGKGRKNKKNNRLTEVENVDPVKKVDLLEEDVFRAYKKETAMKISELGNKFEDLKMKSDDYVLLVNGNLRQMVHDRDELIVQMRERERFLQQELASQTKIVALLTADLVKHARSESSLTCGKIDPPSKPQPAVEICRQEWEVINRTKKPSHPSTQAGRWQNNQQATNLGERNERMSECGDESIVSPNRFAALQTADDEQADNRSEGEHGDPSASEILPSMPIERAPASLLPLPGHVPTRDISTPARKLKVEKRHPYAKRSVTILGDSMIGGIRHQRMNEVLQNRVDVFVKAHGGATVEDLHDHARPALRRDPSLLILHGGTNSLRFVNKSSMQIARDIVELAEATKTPTNDVAISSLVIRKDQLKEKGMEVNRHLKDLCSMKNIWMIDNSNIDIGDLKDDIHLNMGGTVKLADNFLRAIKL